MSIFLKRVVLFILILCFYTHAFSQRQLTDSIHSVMYNNYGLLNKFKSIYTHSKDNLTDTILNYEYSKTGDYYYYSSGNVNSYFEDEKLKSQSSFNYYTNVVSKAYEYKYTNFGAIDEEIRFTYTGGKSIPNSISKYYYTNEKLDSIVRQDYNNYTETWSYDYKKVYVYFDDFYEEIEYTWVPELNVFIEHFKTEYQIEDEKTKKEIYYLKDGEEWAYRFHIDYEYNGDEYSKIDVEKSGNYSKQTYKYKDGDLIEESLYFWSAVYWSLDYKREYTYFRSATNINKIQNISNESNIYSYKDKIYIKTDFETKINIYSITGLAFPINLHTGLNEISLPRGIYLVKGKKLIVQ